MPHSWQAMRIACCASTRHAGAVGGPIECRIPGKDRDEVVIPRSDRDEGSSVRSQCPASEVGTLDRSLRSG